MIQTPRTPEERESLRQKLLKQIAELETQVLQEWREGKDKRTFRIFVLMEYYPYCSPRIEAYTHKEAVLAFLNTTEDLERKQIAWESRERTEPLIEELDDPGEWVDYFVMELKTGVTKRFVAKTSWRKHES